MSGLSCSLACAVFLMVTPWRSSSRQPELLRERHAVLLAQQCDYFNERHIDLGVNRGHDYRVMGFDPIGPARATPGLGVDRPSRPPIAHPANGGRIAYAEALGRPSA